MIPSSIITGNLQGIKGASFNFSVITVITVLFKNNWLVTFSFQKAPKSEKTAITS